MITEHEISLLLTRIERSNSIGSSSTYIRLLRFLVDCTLSETIPKEQAIAEHLFGKNSINSDTSKIRVYVYHLRKKLKLYFENEGKDEAYYLSIPKGAYKVEFEKIEDQTTTTTSNFKKNYLWLLFFGLLFGSLLLNIFFLSIRKTNTSKVFQQTTSWKTFFEDEKPIQIIIGDLLIFSELDSTTGETRIIRIPNLNSSIQFDAYKNAKENSGRHLEEMSYTHLPKASSTWISSLTKIFSPEKEFNIGAGSRMEAKDLHDYNIVFVGMQKTAGIFNSYFDRSKFEYNVKQPNQYLLQNKNELLSFKPTGDPNNEHSDYGFIAKYPGPNENTIFMFGGLWDSAASESLRNFATASKVIEMENYMKLQLGHIPQYFEMLIEVDGVDRIGFETKILYLNEISDL